MAQCDEVKELKLLLPSSQNLYFFFPDLANRGAKGLTPAQQVVPHQVLLLSKHGHHDQSVQVDALTQHPEVVAAKQVQVNEEGDLAAGLNGKHFEE